MDTQRNILLLALALVSFLLFQQWQVETNPQQPATVSTVQQTHKNGDVPTSSTANSDAPVDSAQSDKLITITTDVLTLKVDTLGGDIIESVLNKYDAELDSKAKFVLLKNDADHSYIAQSGLIGPQGIDSNTGRAQFTAKKTDYVLADGQNELRIPLTLEKNGITYTKTLIVKRDSYAIDVEYTVNNQSSAPATVEMYANLKQNLLDDGGSLTMPTYRGGAYSTEDTRYKKYSFDDMEDKNLSIDMTNGQGWAGMLQHYFASAWIPRNVNDATLTTRVAGDYGYIGVRMPSVTIPAGQEDTLTATLWTGPKLQPQMAATAKYLDLSVDYGWLWFIASPLHKLLSFIQSIVGNWGLAIMILTFIVRGAMYPLTKAQYTSMAKMRMLQPKLAAMRERIGDDRQRMSQEMMELYKKEKVNPLGGCLPIVLQMPIFISLYWALMESVELRHAPFFGWITDLSAQDPYYILPLLMGASMFLIQKMSPTTVTDPMQQKIMTFIPVMFTVFFLWFPAGLVLYWLVSNVVTLIQQTLIYRALEKKGLHSK
ncbi:membrane protein insertase YidC [Aliivibrio salmonicida]|uniref:Membrane protein insertase YidC n=1 Tax=Aliivibrio salmonicida (strain LFI1238) TaxID=316275 RepID=YIDC_ALISL|nr:membrane protein insertase YidC [Aliivibrio salmonicida]B6EP40.1 RecName: Full=Membrane protein insertase YidC; AltName: Full=Foldase YidC; AltName: Full=Membrane integrase YidC; AltName: Full=Membrane protein YidC [Aliivibrio salmonicida LFI1238]AZL83617.1 membrane protein insertase YidC [Aliivibrio salmonicida]CAQ77688.1 inner membrane protein [Aliivibrio salmonicida LFI1238]